MKKTIVILLALALVSLACLETAPLAAVEAVMVATWAPVLTKTPTAGARVENGYPFSATPAATCARVIAETAQNLRIDADLRSRIITQLLHGDLVQVISSTNADWWLVKRGDDIGFARSSFLEVVECVR